MTKLEKYLYQLRRIEEHRETAAEKEIRKTYKKLLKELQAYLADIYVSYSEDDMLSYGDLAKAGMDARFLEEVEQRINDVTPDVAREINTTVALTYEACYDGMVNAVTKAADNRQQLLEAFKTVSAVTPDVVKRAVQNPVSGLTLNDTLEKHRKEIIYDIKRHIGVGLANGDRFTSMSKRIAESLDGDYKKSVRIVRTEAHRVRESGYSDAATALNDTLKQGKSGFVMAKTWRTMQDERVRPNTVYKTKKGLKRGKKGKYNHEKMDGVTIPQDELFKLPSGATCMCPSQTGVAGEDINCRCYLSYDLVPASQLTGAKDTTSKQPASLENYTEHNEKYLKNNIYRYITPEKDKEIGDAIKAIVDSNDLAMRVPSEALDDILKSGEFKTQLETGTTRGTFNDRYRREASRELFGAKDLKANEYEKYGYLCGKDKAAAFMDEQTEQYGNLIVTFKKKNVADRTTITVGDSLNRAINGRVGAAPIAAPNASAIPWTMLDNNMGDIDKLVSAVQGGMADMPDMLAKHVLHERYFELQFHGKLTLDDIESIAVKRNTLTSAQVEKLEKLGINLEVVD